MTVALSCQALLPCLVLCAEQGDAVKEAVWAQRVLLLTGGGRRREGFSEVPSESTCRRERAGPEPLVPQGTCHYPFSLRGGCHITVHAHLVRPALSTPCWPVELLLSPENPAQAFLLQGTPVDSLWAWNRGEYRSFFLASLPPTKLGACEDQRVMLILPWPPSP